MNKQGSNWTGTHRNGIPVLFLKTGTAFRFIFWKSERNSDSFCCVDKSASIPGYFEAKIKYWAIGVCYCTILGVSLLDTCTYE